MYLQNQPNIHGNFIFLNEIDGMTCLSTPFIYRMIRPEKYIFCGIPPKIKSLTALFASKKIISKH